MTTTDSAKGFAHVFKGGNGNNQHGKPYPTKNDRRGDGSKAKKALGVSGSSSKPQKIAFGWGADLGVVK